MVSFIHRKGRCKPKAPFIINRVRAYACGFSIPQQKDLCISIEFHYINLDYSATPGSDKTAVLEPCRDKSKSLPPYRSDGEDSCSYLNKETRFIVQLPGYFKCGRGPAYCSWLVYLHHLSHAYHPPSLRTKNVVSGQHDKIPLGHFTHLN
jgi:hypothetical protein